MVAPSTCQVTHEQGLPFSIRLLAATIVGIAVYGIGGIAHEAATCKGSLGSDGVGIETIYVDSR